MTKTRSDRLSPNQAIKHQISISVSMSSANPPSSARLCSQKERRNDAPFAQADLWIVG